MNKNTSYSNDTEVMTNNGWKLIKDVDSQTDNVLSLNPETNLMEMDEVVDCNQISVTGYLHHFHNRNMDFCVTGNHKMLSYYRDCHRNYKLMPPTSAEDIKKSHAVPIADFKWKGKSCDEFILPATTQIQQYTRKEIVVEEKSIPMKAWLEFFGFWIADGCYRDHINAYGTRDYTISIKQHVSNEEYVLGLIEGIGFHAEISRGENGHNNYCIYSKQLWEYLSQFGRSEDKYIPREYLDLDTEYLVALFTGYSNGDSSFNKVGQTHFSSVSKKLMEAVQELILKIYGTIVKVHRRRTKHSYDDNYCVSYEIGVTLQKDRDKFSYYGTPDMVPYNDNVYCLTLKKSHFILTRRNGVVGWC